MLRRMAVVFGAVFILVGFLGFVPGITRDGHLLGIFHVNPAHNVVHLLTGAVAISCAAASAHACQVFFRIFGIVYALVAVLGFVQGNGMLLGAIANNIADAWLHAGIAAVSLFLGFGVREAATALG